MEKSDQEKYVEMMEMKTNKAAKDIIHLLHSQNLDEQASIVSILKASAILLEALASVGGDADKLETMIREMIGPAREEARRLMFKDDLTDIFNN